MLTQFPDHIFHMVSIGILLLRLRTTKSVMGLSVKTQECYLMVFLARYMDLFYSNSIFNSIMKLLCIVLTGYLIYMVRCTEPYKTGYLAYHNDTFHHWKFIVAPAAVGMLITDFFISPLNIQQLLWIFSVYVETIAILPQLIMLHRHQETECLSMAYVFFLGVYRLLFVLNWIHRSYYDRYFDTAGSIEHVFGAVQTVVYFIFFAVYVRIKYRDSLQKLY